MSVDGFIIADGEGIWRRHEKGSTRACTPAEARILAETFLAPPGHTVVLRPLRPISNWDDGCFVVYAVKDGRYKRLPIECIEPGVLGCVIQNGSK